MPIVESDGRPSWSLDASETGKRSTSQNHGFFVLSSVSLASRDWPRWRPGGLNDRHLRSHRKKRGTVNSLSPQGIWNWTKHCTIRLVIYQYCGTTWIWTTMWNKHLPPPLPPHVGIDFCRFISMHFLQKNHVCILSATRFCVFFCNC